MQGSGRGLQKIQKNQKLIVVEGSVREALEAALVVKDSALSVDLGTRFCARHPIERPGAQDLGQWLSVKNGVRCFPCVDGVSAGECFGS